jgi:mono/diheme cytochrome c family protein
MPSRLTVLAGALSLAVMVTAAGAATGNQNRGKSLFKSTCKTCHVKNGASKDLSPLSKTQAQWERVFKKPIEAMVARIEQKHEKKLTAADLNDMRAYLVAHAADSDQPETCGIK